MARPRVPGRVPARTAVSGNLVSAKTGALLAAAGAPTALSASAAVSAQVYRQNRRVNPSTDRRSIAKPWQEEVYRHVNICGEARFAATLFANLAGRAELGISEPQTLARKPVWVNSGIEVEALAELAPTVRERTKLIRDYMLHRVLAGECYLIARDRVETDPEYADREHEPIWEIVAVTELRRVGEKWQVRHENGNWLDLSASDPIIRMWVADPSERQEAWSPFRSLLPTLREIEWLTKHIFTQVRSRLMSAGVWFLPENLTFPPPPPDAVEGGAEAIAEMNEAEQFMVSLAASSMDMLDGDEVSFPSIVMSDAAALAAIDQNKLIKFWSEIDDKAMTLRSDAVRRFALGMDLPPEQVLGSSGVAISGSGGSAGSVNHWGEWANEEKTIAGHIEPALDDFTGILTTAFLRVAVEGTKRVIAYDPTSIRMKQDRSKEAIELYDRGELKASVMLREVGFDPENDAMDDVEHKRWVLNKLASGSATPEMVFGALSLMGIDLPVPIQSIQTPTGPASERDGDGDGVLDEANGGRRALPAPQIPDSATRSLREHPVQGPPQVQHDHSPAPFTALHASAEVLVLRALEKAGNRLLNDGKRGRDKDRSTPAHLAHLTASYESMPEFDFTLLPTVFCEASAMEQALLARALNRYCQDLYIKGDAYSREGLIAALEAVNQP